MSIIAPFLDAVTRWGEGRDDVRAIALVGSQARTGTPADEFSDVDLALGVERPESYIESAEWVAVFGRPLLTLVEATAVGGQLEQRVLYEDGLEVDFSVFPVGVLRELARDPVGASVLAPGYRMLVDKGSTPR